MQKIGLYIGRFQPFHNGHKKIVDTMLEENDCCVILIGLSSQEDTNPFDYNTRLHFFTHTYSTSENMRVYPLPDENSDITWIEHIINFPEIYTATEIHIYCGDREHDSAIQVIQEHNMMFGMKKIIFHELSRKETPFSGTEIRDNIKKQGLQSIEKKVPLEVFQYLEQS